MPPSRAAHPPASPSPTSTFPLHRRRSLHHRCTPVHPALHRLLSRPHTTSRTILPAPHSRTSPLRSTRRSAWRRRRSLTASRATSMPLPAWSLILSTRQAWRAAWDSWRRCMERSEVVMKEGEQVELLSISWWISFVGFFCRMLEFGFGFGSECVVHSHCPLLGSASLEI